MQLDEWLDYDFPTDIRSHMTGSWTRYRGQTQKWCGLTRLQGLYCTKPALRVA